MQTSSFRYSLPQESLSNRSPVKFGHKPFSQAVPTAIALEALPSPLEPSSQWLENSSFCLRQIYDHILQLTQQKTMQWTVTSEGTSQVAMAYDPNPALRRPDKQRVVYKVWFEPEVSIGVVMKGERQRDEEGLSIPVALMGRKHLEQLVTAIKASVQ